MLAITQGQQVQQGQQRPQPLRHLQQHSVTHAHVENPVLRQPVQQEQLTYAELTHNQDENFFWNIGGPILGGAGMIAGATVLAATSDEEGSNIPVAAGLAAGGVALALAGISTNEGV